LSRTVNGVTETYAYDDGDKLLSVSVGGSPVKTYGYDPAGRRTSMVDGTGTMAWTYDVAGQLIQLYQPQGTVTSTYDATE